MTIKGDKFDTLRVAYLAGHRTTRAAIDANVSGVTALKYFRQFESDGLKRGQMYVRYSRRGRPYTGPLTAGLPITAPTMPDGPDWAGERLSWV